MSNSTMGDGAGYFPRPPTPSQVEDFRSFVRTTKQPELYPQLSHTPPDLALDHKILCKVDVPRKQRPDGSLIPCTLCGGIPKFCEGRLLWSSDCRIRLIGHCCAHQYFEGKFAEIEKEYEDAQLEQANQYYLIDTLPLVPDLIEGLKRLVPLAKEYQSRKKALFRGAPQLMAALRRQCRDSEGELIVARRKDQNSSVGPRGFRGLSSAFGGGASEFELDRVGTIRGRTFLTWTRNPMVLISEYIMDLYSIGGRSSDEDDALEAVCEMDRVKLAATAKSLKLTIRRIDQLREYLAALPVFFSKENLVALKRWCDDPDGPGYYGIRFDGGVLRVKDRGRIFATVPIDLQIRLPSN